MKHWKRSLFALGLALTLGAPMSLRAFGEGAVSGGGGGTTNPKPADPEWVIGSVYHFGAPVIQAWLNRQEKEFDRLSAEARAKSPFRKLFAGGRPIFAAMKRSQVEYRMSKPCLDASGAPQDGSIYATRPGAICLSPFRMAPRLNENNVQQETLALLVHELSHLVGAGEKEAIAIQQAALWDFNRTDLLDVAITADILGKTDATGDFSYALVFFDGWLANPKYIRSTDLERWEDTLARLVEKIDSSHRTVLFLPAPTMARFRPELVRLRALRDYVSSTDSRLDEAERKIYANRLSKGFAGDEKVTARNYLSRTSGIDASVFESAYDDVTIRKLTSRGDLAAELGLIKDFLLKARNDVSALATADLPGYRLP